SRAHRNTALRAYRNPLRRDAKGRGNRFFPPRRFNVLSVPSPTGSTRREHSAPRDVGAERPSGGQRSDGLLEPERLGSPCRHIRGQDLEGREASGSSGRAAHQVRAGDQCQGGEGTRLAAPTDLAAAGGSASRMITRRVFVLVSAAATLWPLPAESEAADKVRRVGVLMSTTPVAASHIVVAFADSLR